MRLPVLQFSSAFPKIHSQFALKILQIPDLAANLDEFVFQKVSDGFTRIAATVSQIHVGEFDRGIDSGNINRAISNYNASIAGSPTPAGQVLIENGLMTSAQLTSLGAVAPALPAAPRNQVNLGWLHVFDATMSWTYSIKERLFVKPSVGFYNIFNFSNFDLPSSTMSGLLAGTAGTINGTDSAAHNTNRVGWVVACSR